ncbi:MAG: hypothetical protein ACTSR8_19090 [Promethearchaeota archaeon]
MLSISKKDGNLLKCLKDKFSYHPAIPYLYSGYIDKGTYISFSGFKYFKNFIINALKIFDSEKNLLVQIPLNQMAPIILFPGEINYAITIAPIEIENKI